MSQQTPPSPQLKALTLFTLLPTALFYGSFLARYGNTIMLRRDENIVLLLVAELARGRSANDLLALVISPAFLVLLHTLAPIVAPIVLGRAIVMLSALACAALTASIARRLSAAPVVPPLALALVLSSPLFVAEGTQIRLDLPSLTFALGAVAVALGVEPGARRWERPFLTGMLLGVAVLVKPLALMMAPFALYALWHAYAFPRSLAVGEELVATSLMATASQSQTNSSVALNRAALFSMRGLVTLRVPLFALLAGLLLPSVALLLLPGLGGMRLLGQLAAHTSTSARIALDIRLAHTVAIAVEFVAGHFWLVVAFALALYQAFRRREPGGLSRRNAALLGVWAACVVAALFVSFPTWDHHYVYLLPALAIGAAQLLGEIGQSLFASARRRTGRGLLVLCLAIGSVGVLNAEAALPAQQIPPDIEAAATRLRERVPPGERIWSDNTALPLLADRPTDPELIDLSMKRVLAGELRQRDLFRLFAQHPPAAVVAYDGLFAPYRVFMRCLGAASDAEQIAPGGKTLLWVRSGDAASVAGCEDSR